MCRVPECLDCGTCCFSRIENYVRVMGDDHRRLGEQADELVRFDGNRAYMRMSDGHCASLLLDLELNRFVCGSYALRPQVCRDLLRGSSECHGELGRKQARPPALVQLLRRKAGSRAFPPLI